MMDFCIGSKKLLSFILIVSLYISLSVTLCNGASKETSSWAVFGSSDTGFSTSSLSANSPLPANQAAQPLPKSGFKSFVGKVAIAVLGLVIIYTVFKCVKDAKDKKEKEERRKKLAKAKKLTEDAAKKLKDDEAKRKDAEQKRIKEEARLEREKKLKKQREERKAKRIEEQKEIEKLKAELEEISPLIRKATIDYTSFSDENPDPVDNYEEALEKRSKEFMDHQLGKAERRLKEDPSVIISDDEGKARVKSMKQKIYDEKIVQYAKLANPAALTLGWEAFSEEFNTSWYGVTVSCFRVQVATTSIIGHTAISEEQIREYTDAIYKAFKDEYGEDYRRREELRADGLVERFKRLTTLNNINAYFNGKLQEALKDLNKHDIWLLEEADLEL